MRGRCRSLKNVCRRRPLSNDGFWPRRPPASLRARGAQVATALQKSSLQQPHDPLPSAAAAAAAGRQLGFCRQRLGVIGFRVNLKT